MNSYSSSEMLISDEGRHRLLVDAILDYAIYMLDRNGVVSSWNSGAQRIKGYEAYEIVGENFSKFYTEEDRAAKVPARALQTAVDEGRFEAEGWRVRKDGGRFWAHVIIDPIHAANGEVVGFAKITRDLTERMMARDELRRSEEQFRLLVQSVTDYAIFMLDKQGHVSTWNAGAERIKGYKPEEILTKHFSCFYTEEDRAAGIPGLALETARREGRWEHEGLRVRKDGTTFIAHVVIDSIKDEAGNITGFAKVTQDITERRRIRTALEQAQRALFQSQKMESIGQLTGGVAHDFNNLLTAISNSHELLRKRLGNDPKGLELLDNAIRGTERGIGLTQRMLAFARRQDLKIESIDLSEVMSGMQGMLERSLQLSVALHMEVPPSLPRVLSDANQLETALLNLALNARDAMPEGGTIRISARTRSLSNQNSEDLPEGNYVLIAVADSGSGMDERTLARAVEPFFTTKGVGKGTGLGLSMVQGLAEQSGGKLQLDSKLGCGTTATLWLRATDSRVEKAKAISLAPRASSHACVLLVDDDSLVRATACALLEDAGYQVFTAESGVDALEIAAKEPSIDILVTDQIMPHMTGLQLVEAIRSIRPDLPAILATGYAELLRPMPANSARLAKPFRVAELTRLIEASLYK
jgi:PAS domain S-box-containing protein